MTPHKPTALDCLIRPSRLLPRSAKDDHEHRHTVDAASSSDFNAASGFFDRSAKMPAKGWKPEQFLLRGKSKLISQGGQHDGYVHVTLMIRAEYIGCN